MEKKSTIFIIIAVIVILLEAAAVIVVILNMRDDKSNSQTNVDNTDSNSDQETEVFKQYSYEVINTYPHDPEAYTQGLIFENGYLYEGTGLYEESSLRKVDLETGEVLEKVDMDATLFGEGITIFEDKIFQLTWKAQKGFVYKKENFELLEEFTYETEGWGLTHDGEYLIMSNGSNTLYYLDPETLKQVKQISVSDKSGPVENINELEYIKGKIFANVWLTDEIIQISPETGKVIGKVDMTGLLPKKDKTDKTDVLNGIAYDAENDRMFVTGKLWPKLFEIKLSSLLIAPD